LREQRDLQGKDPNYKVLMIRITCTISGQVFLSQRLLAGRGRGKQARRRKAAGNQELRTQEPGTPNHQEPGAESGTIALRSHLMDYRAPLSIRDFSRKVAHPLSLLAGSQPLGCQGGSAPLCFSFCLVSAVLRTSDEFAENGRPQILGGNLFSVNKITWRAC
jgi:hypothetical protein